MTDLIDRIWDIVVGHEGDRLDLTHEDSGNWTGGKVGVGTLRGSKFGISAARYPTTDIAALSYQAAKVLFTRDYWNANACGSLPGPLALLVVDAAYNGGHPIRWLQQVVGVPVDGVWGAVSQAALAKLIALGALSTVAAEFMAHRLAYLTALDDWRVFGARDGEPMGWARRLSLLPYQAISLGASS